MQDSFQLKCRGPKSYAAKFRAVQLFDREIGLQIVSLNIFHGECDLICGKVYRAETIGCALSDLAFVCSVQVHFPDLPALALVSLCGEEDLRALETNLGISGSEKPVRQKHLVFFCRSQIQTDNPAALRETLRQPACSQQRCLNKDDVWTRGGRQTFLLCGKGLRG